MATRYLIGKGELLASPIDPPPMAPNKVHPYTLHEAKQIVVPQIIRAVQDLMTLPPTACPGDIAVAKLDLHPSYIAKSFYPKALLRRAGLTAVGSYSIKLKPRKEVRKNAPPQSETTRLLIAGTRGAFEAFPALAMGLQDETIEGLQFAEIENFSSMTAGDRLKLPVKSKLESTVFEIGLHKIPGWSTAQERRQFVTYAKKLGFTVNEDFEFPIGGMLFLAAEGDPEGLRELAQFSLVRVIRPMPALRSIRPPEVSRWPLASEFRVGSPCRMSLRWPS